MEDIPKSLKHVLKHFPIIRKRVRCNVSTPTLVNGNPLRVFLPSGALLDMNSFEVQFSVGINAGDITCSNSTDGKKTQIIPKAHAFWSRVNPIINSVSTGAANNNWNQMAEAVWLQSKSNEWSKSNPLGRYIGVAPPNATASNYPDGKGVVYSNWFPNTLMSSGAVLNTHLIPTGNEVELIADNGNIFTVDVGNDAVVSYILSDIRAYVDVLIMEDNTYSDSLQYLLREGRDLKILCESSVATIQSNNGSNQFNVASASLDGVLVGIKAENYNTTAAQVVGHASLAWNGSKYLRFESGLTYDNTAQTAASTNFYLQLNQDTFPSYGQSENALALLEMTRDFYGGPSSYNFNQLCSVQTGEGGTSSSIANYLDDNYCGVIGLCESRAASNGGFCTGYNTLGNNSMLVFRTSSTEWDATYQWLLCGLTSSQIIIRDGGAVAFQQ